MQQKGFVYSRRVSATDSSYCNWFVGRIFSITLFSLEIAKENGQSPNERVPFKDETWKGTKSRTRDATLSRYAGIEVNSLHLTNKVGYPLREFAQ